MSLKDVDEWENIFKDFEKGTVASVHGWMAYDDMKVLNGSVLDVGCGDSGFLNYVKPSNDDYLVGLDFSKNALMLAKKRAKDKNVLLVRGAAQYLPFRDDAFDKVICIEVIKHAIDYEKILKEIQRVTNSEAFFTFHHRDYKDKDRLNVTFFDEAEAISMLEKAGFHCKAPKIYKVGDILSIDSFFSLPSNYPSPETKAIIQIECEKNKTLKNI